MAARDRPGHDLLHPGRMAWPGCIEPLDQIVLMIGVMPPSMMKSEPVTQADSSEAR